MGRRHAHRPGVLSIGAGGPGRSGAASRRDHRCGRERRDGAGDRGGQRPGDHALGDGVAEVPRPGPSSGEGSAEGVAGTGRVDRVDREGVKWVPARAVQADSGLKPRVWVLDSKTMTVSSKEVEIGRMSGRMIQIYGGLEGGEEIVAVGAPYLAEGMNVTRMAQTEQAVPRSDDPL